MKIIIFFGDFGVGKTFITNIIKNWYQNVYSINIYDFISYRLFRNFIDKDVLESNPFVEFMTYKNIFKEYKIKKFIYDNYRKFDTPWGFLDHLYNNELNTMKKCNINIDHDIKKYPEYFSSEDFKAFIYLKTREIADRLRECGLQHNYIEYLISNDLNKFIGFAYKIFDIIVYYGYSIKEFEILRNKFMNNIVYIENTNLTHINLINDEKKINTLLSDEYQNKKEYIKRNCNKRIINNLELYDDLSNKIRSLLIDIPDFTRSF